jgi:3-oxoacyl-[acyl-carrier-protein] synthase III
MTLKVTPGARYSAILGVGGYRPRRVVDNAEICTMIDSTDEWIRTRSGIIERRWASDDETIQMMSVAAARKALDRAGIEAGQIDTVIVSTVTHLYQTPAVATAIASELGAKSAAAFDISAACAGFCYATAMADSFIRSGASKYVVIIGVERLTDMTNRSDRSTAFLFADGAGAAVVGPSDTAGIGPVVWGSDGDQAPLIQQTEPWDAALAWDTESYRSTDGGASWPTLRMEGNPVFKWASYTMAKTAAEALDAAGVRPEDLDVFAPHQANMRITDAMFRALKLPGRVVVARDIARQGNTSAASIPLAIEALLESGEAHSGQSCLIIGFGAGLVYAGQVIILP